MDNDKIPYLAARKAAEGREWEAPSGLTGDWLKNLSGGARAPLGEVIDLLAFGPSMSPDGLSNVEAATKRIIASNRLLLAAASKGLQIFGTRAELIPHLLGTTGCRTLTPSGRIDPAEFENGRLSLSPKNYHWLCLTDLANDPSKWFMVKCADVVRYCNITIDRESLGAWLKPSKKRGRPPEFPWKELKDETFRLMDFHGDFTSDDPKWNVQARLKKALVEYCEKLVSRAPSESQLQSYIAVWLKEWRSVKVTSGN